MSVSDADIAFALDLFDPLGELTKRKMFGGLGLYCHGTIFAVLDKQGKIFLKAKGDAADRLQATGAARFHNMPYWALPDDALDTPDDAVTWARETMASLTE